LNFLAHIYLSGDNEELMIGNFVADYVKGNKMYDYPEGIRKGIELHRKIDFFTDHHSITSRSKDPLRGKYRHYSGVLVDLFYDHFLAKNFPDYSTLNLTDYTLITYEKLSRRKSDLPDGVQHFLPIMIERNWLLSYASLEGINRVMTGLSKRVNFENRMDEAIHDLKTGYPAFEADFSEFFPELITFVQQEIHQ